MIAWFLLEVLVILLFYYWYKRPKNFPPGPRGFPLIGIVPYLDKNPGLTFATWRKKYGNVLSVRMGREDFVVLQNFETVQRALVKGGLVFSGRPQVPLFQEISQGHGLIFIDYNEKWKSHRKFGVRALKGMGFGSKSIEKQILQETEQFMQSIQSEQGKAFNILDKVSRAASNNICSVVFGERFEYDNPVFKELMEVMERRFSVPNTTLHINLMTFAPILAYIPPFSSTVTEIRQDTKIVRGILSGKIKEHKDIYNSDNIRDFIDAFLFEINKGEDKTFTNLQLLQFVRDLFVAGTETTATTIRWCLLCLLHYPETEAKVYKCIENAVGLSGTIKYSQRDQMPYVNAFIEEVFRYRVLASLALHKTSDDVTFNGYFIPKNTTVLINLWAVHNDPELWENPEKFIPERHLNEKEEFVKSNHVIPFGLGPRHCLGEQLARMEVFIFLATLVQKFRFKPDPAESSLPEINDGCHGTIFGPFKYKIIAEER